METVNRALALDPNSQLAHWAKAIIHHAARDTEMFLAEAERAVALNPNDAMTTLYMGHYMALMGNWDRGLALVDKAVALQPPWAILANEGLMNGNHMYQREFEKALEISYEVGDNDYLSWVIRASLLGNLGRVEDAKLAVSNLRRVFPGFTIEMAREQSEKRNFPPELTEILVHGLHIAGLDSHDVSTVED